MKIKLYGHDLNLDMDETLQKKTGAYGQLHIDELRMSIDATLPKSIKGSTIIHEIVEAINYFQELGFEHNVISSVATGIHEALVRNPFLLRLLLESREISAKQDVKSIYDKKEFPVDYKDFDKAITQIIRET